MQLLSSVFANGLKLNIVESVQPKTKGIHDPLSTLPKDQS